MRSILLNILRQTIKYIRNRRAGRKEIGLCDDKRVKGLVKGGEGRMQASFLHQSS